MASDLKVKTFICKKTEVHYVGGYILYRLHHSVVDGEFAEGLSKVVVNYRQDTSTETSEKLRIIRVPLENRPCSDLVSASEMCDCSLLPVALTDGPVSALEGHG